MAIIAGFSIVSAIISCSSIVENKPGYTAPRTMVPSEIPKTQIRSLTLSLFQMKQVKAPVC